MAEFKYQATSALRKLFVDNNDFVLPLCTKCKNKDCDLPIESKTFALPVIGNKVLRVLVQGRDIKFVVNCEGYIKK